MTGIRIQFGFFLLLVAVVVTLSFFIFKPYLPALFLALVFFVTLRPLHRRVLQSFSRKHQGLVALLFTFIALVAILLPLIFLGFLLFEDAKDFYFRIIAESDGANVFHEWSNTLEGYVQTYIPTANFNIEAYLDEGAVQFLSQFDNFFSGFFKVAIGVFLMLLALFYLFKDGTALKEIVMGISPLSNHYDQDIFNRIEVAINSVVRGQLLISLIQGFLTAIGFLIFGVPNAVLWGSVGAIAALIPTLGTALVIAPAIGFLLFQGAMVKALGLLIWGIVAVGLIDNILGPILIERGIRIHPFLVLLSVLGGISFFGLIGFIVGPVLLALLVTLVNMFPAIVTEMDS